MLSKLVYWLTIAPRMRALKKALPKAVIYPTGSRYTCSPPVMTTDIDFVVYTPEDMDYLIEAMGFVPSLNETYHFSTDDWPFRSWRRGKVNLIVTPSEEFIVRHRVATHICKKWNIRDKLERVFVHEAVRTGLGETFPSYYPANVAVMQLLKTFSGPHGHTMLQLYKIQHLA